MEIQAERDGAADKKASARAHLGLVIGRHEALLAAAAALTPATLTGSDGFKYWVVHFVLIQIAAALVAGAVWLFFTKLSKGKVLWNWMATSWALMALSLLGSWT